MQAYFQIQCHKQYQEGVHEKALMIAWRLVFGRVVEASRGISFLFCIVIPPRDKPSQIGSDVHDREKREFKLAEMQRHTRTEVNVPRSSRSPTIVTRSLALSFSSESIKQHIIFYTGVITVINTVYGILWIYPLYVSMTRLGSKWLFYSFNHFVVYFVVNGKWERHNLSDDFHVWLCLN